MDNMEGKAEGVDEAVGVLPESNPSAQVIDGDFSLISGTPDAPSAAPYVVREDPITTTRQVGIRTESNTDRPGSIKHSNIMPVTQWIWDDEECSNYREMDLLDPNWRTYRRYRLCWVVRNDTLAEYIEDMGPSSEVFGGPVNIIGGEGTVIVETYATMKEMADKFRSMLWPHQQYEMKAFESKPDLGGRRIL